MKCLIVFINFSIIAHYGYSEMTEKQLKATQKLVRNTCQNKVKATTDELDAMRAGNFDQGKTAQCYMLCIMSTYKLFTKEGSFNWEAGVQSLKSVAPEKIAVPGVESIKNCKDAKKASDKCLGALEIAKCLYNDNPQNYFLP